MNSSLIAACLLLMTGLALAFLPRRTALGGAALTAGFVFVGAAMPRIPANLALAGVCASFILVALAVYWPKPVRRLPTVGWVLPPFVGIWAGLLIGQDGGMVAAAQISPALFAAVPAAWCISRGWQIVPKVVTSWLLAVALLAGAIAIMVEHPGYVADHRL